ncbi:CUBN [Mytilus coruscus]|uniref:CUBN n=1 Tax=Mytilus coruscus TaxID=42192 RepID=A0A6J8AZC7_MYTCO|nr:CUBN [Mytilus coruscus]
MILTFLVVFLHEVLAAESEEILRDRSDIKVKTPNYPDNYPQNSTKIWRFKHNYGVWSVSIDRFFLENSLDCRKDFLEIKENKTSVKVCGTKPSGSLYTSKGPEILLKFSSDGSQQQMGFHLEVLHFVTEDDIEKTINDRERKRAARANVTKVVEGKLTDSVLFLTLVSLLGLALVSFILLIIYYVVNVNRKHRRQNSHYNRNVVFQTPIIAQKSRRYSKSNSREDSKAEVNRDNRTPTRYV